MSNPHTPQKSPSMFSPLILSLLVHVGIVVVALSTGLFDTDVEEIKETAVMVEFANTDTVASTKKVEKVPESKEEVPPPLDDKPQPAPKALEQPEPKKEKAEVKEDAPVERVKPTEAVKPEPPKKEPEKPKEKPKPKPEPKKPETPKKEEVEKPKEKDTTTGFASVLKNLADTQPVDTTKSGPTLTESPTVDRITAGELGAFQQQLQGCWSLLPGAANADSMAVNLTISVNKDRTVRDVQITDKSRYQSDAVFRAAADNAMRALRHPDCTPLDLPIYKYEQWKTITINFDPKGMF